MDWASLFILSYLLCHGSSLTAIEDSLRFPMWHHPAGVVLTLTIPPVSTGTGTGTVTLKSPLTPMGSAHGHTGHVRFLTSIELPEGFDMKFPPAITVDSTGNPPPPISADTRLKIQSCILF